MERDERLMKLGMVFSPGAPVNQRDLFAGRLVQWGDVAAAVGSRGQHVILYGERGVGKTSLATIVTSAARQSFVVPDNPTGTVNCSPDDTFSVLWNRAFRDIVLTTEQASVGFQESVAKKRVSLIDLVDTAGRTDLDPDDIRYLLQKLPPTLVVFDEVDRIQDPDCMRLMADTLKNLSDHSVPATVMLVGVADSVTDLIAEHASVERSITQVQMPRMSIPELVQILEKGFGAVGMTATPAACERIAWLSRGLPHYTHLLGLEVGKLVANADATQVKLEDVVAAIPSAVRKAQQSIMRAYHAAVSSPRQNTLYPQVLLACALAPTDGLGFFAAADVRAPLRKITGEQYEIPAYSQHLHNLSDAPRGPVLQKVGVKRKFRFRFINPLLQPFIVMKGMQDGLISDAQLSAFAFDVS